MVKFINEQENDLVFEVELLDISDYKYNYSEFELTEGVDLTLSIEGFYLCEFWNDGNLIKTEKAKVINGSEIIPTFEGVPTNNKIFNG